MCYVVKTTTNGKSHRKERKKQTKPQQAFIFLYVVKQSVRPKKQYIQVEKPLEKVK